MKKLIATFGFTTALLTVAAQTPAVQIATSGKGEPVIYLPGFTTPGSVWDETILHLSQPFENHVVSYAGFNGIPPVDTPWYEKIKKEILAHIEDKGLHGIRMVGHSMGGTLAVDIAADIPERIKGLVLVDALPCMRELMMPGVTADQIQYDSPYNNRMLSMTDEAFAQLADMMARNMTASPDRVNLVREWIIHADRKTYVYGYTDLLKLDVRSCLTRIKAPVLILGAPFPDADVVRANFEKQYATLPKKSIKIADGGKHFIMFDEPEWFYNQVNTFFRQ